MTRDELINMKPFKTTMLNQIIIIMFYITTVLAMKNQLSSSGLSLLAVGFSLAPTFLLLLTVVPVYQIVYFRAVYYLVWIYIICIEVKYSAINLISVVEPLCYFIACIISVISLGGARDER